MKKHFIFTLFTLLTLQGGIAQSKWTFTPKLGFTIPLHRFQNTIIDPNLMPEHIHVVTNTQFPQKGIVGGIAVQRNWSTYFALVSELNFMYRENVWLRPLPASGNSGYLATYNNALTLQVPVIGVFQPVKPVSIEGGIMGNYLLSSSPNDEFILNRATVATVAGVGFHLNKLRLGLRWTRDVTAFSRHLISCNTNTDEFRQDVQVTVGWRI
jgi:hypothetical protein